MLELLRLTGCLLPACFGLLGLAECGSPSSRGHVDGPGRGSPPAKLALLVGIERYAPGTPDSFSKLSGCVRDIGLVKRVLVDRFGFLPEDVDLLANEQATHQGIVRSFRERLIERAGPETEVLFWFSGHGSRAPDLSGSAGAEVDGMDATLLAYDSRAQGEDGSFDVSDDELGSLLAGLAGKTGRITVVTDACHSGGATRGARSLLERRVRGVSQGSRPVDLEGLRNSFWPKDVPLLDDDAASRALAPHVHIAACGPRQVAQEIDVEGDDGSLESHGALTFYLVQRLRDAQPKTSYRRIADDVSVRVSTSCPAQTVWAEGALSRELFGSGFEPRPTGFRARAERVRAAGGDHIDVRVEAGTVHGLRRGSVLALHDESQLVGRAEVTRVHATSSLARWIGPTPTETPTGALRALEATRPAEEQPLAIYVPEAGVAAIVAASGRARVVSGDVRAAEYALLAESDGKLALLGAGGVRIWKEDEALPREAGVLGARIEDEFREELRYRALMALAAEKGSLQIAGRFVSPEESELDRFRAIVDPRTREPEYERCFDAAPRGEGQGGASPAGTVFHARGTPAPERELSLAILVVENRDTRPIHVAVLSVSEDRQRNPIWPREDEKDRVLAPGEHVRVPVNVVSSPDWKAARPMRDRYLVLATLVPADFTPLAKESTTRGEPESIRMPEILALALERPETRGLPRATTDDSGYGLDVVDLYVESPEER